MADPNRLPVTNLLLHHAVTPRWDDKSKAWLINWFSDNGFARGYGSNPNNWSGLKKPNGQRSYSMAQFCGQKVTSRTPDATAAEKKAGYRIVTLVQKPFDNICWHAGNWEMNRKSVAIENLGDFRNYTLSDAECKVVADFWRPHDKARGGKTYVTLHFEVYATACPARISEKRNKIVGYINNPPAAPKPPAPKPVTRTKRTVYDPPKKMVFNQDADLVNIPANTKITGSGAVHFKKGDIITQVGDYQKYSDGKAFYRTVSSVKGNRQTGVGTSKLDDYVEPPKWEPMTNPRRLAVPINTAMYSSSDRKPTGSKTTSLVIASFSEKITIDKTLYVRVKGAVVCYKFDDLQEYVPPVTPDPVPEEPSRDDKQDEEISAIKRLLQSISDAIQSFLAKFK